MTPELQTFIEAAQAEVTADYRMFSPDYMQGVPKLSLQLGKRYARIVSESGGQRSAFGFVDMLSGDVLKSAGWKGPTNNFTRGNIADADKGCGRIRWTGVY